MSRDDSRILIANSRERFAVGNEDGEKKKVKVLVVALSWRLCRDVEAMAMPASLVPLLEYEEFTIRGGLMAVVNVGDSRVVLATSSDDGAITVVQLIVHLKPNLTQEEHIWWCNDQVYYLADEPGVHFVW
uniref:protein-serine/threonine phosphatase n=1 Tax=Zea mays TaxID=4577 RepID=A0A804QPY3_MAIZE